MCLKTGIIEVRVEYIELESGGNHIPLTSIHIIVMPPSPIMHLTLLGYCYPITIHTELS
jgi:hypothetical protein